MFTIVLTMGVEEDFNWANSILLIQAKQLKIVIENISLPSTVPK